MNSAEIITCLLDFGILYYVAFEYYESKQVNALLTQLLDKQKGQKKKVSVDRIIKTALQKGNN